MGGDNGGENGEGFSGTTIKNTRTKPRRGGIGREVGMPGGVDRKLYLNNNF